MTSSRLPVAGSTRSRRMTSAMSAWTFGEVCERRAVEDLALEQQVAQRDQQRPALLQDSLRALALGLEDRADLAIDAGARRLGHRRGVIVRPPADADLAAAVAVALDERARDLGRVVEVAGRADRHVVEQQRLGLAPAEQPADRIAQLRHGAHVAVRRGGG